MSKKVKASTQLRQVRILERLAISKKTLQPPAEINLCILGNGAIGSPRSLYVFTDHFRYLFNCGEGTQRLAHEYKMKLSKLHHVFFTHKSWRNLGGLLGLSLTIQDIGVPQITLHGPPGIENLYKYSNSFIVLKNLIPDKRNHINDPFLDECMEVHYVVMYATPSKSNYENGTNQSSEENASYCGKKRKFSCDTDSDLVVAYICKGHSKPGHLDSKKCLEQGVPPGPLLGELKSGKDVTLPSGKIICSSDVMSEEEKCPVFIVLECPSEDFIDPLLNEEKFQKYQKNSSESPAALIIHFTPYHIVENHRYQEWIHMFPETTVHLFLNEKCSSANSIAVHRVQNMLNLIHPNIFRLLNENEALEDCLLFNKTNLFLAKPLDKYFLRPHKGLDRRSSVTIDSEAFIEEAKNTPGFVGSLQELNKTIEKNHVCTNKDVKYPEILFLGTGSSIPSKVRNVSSILVNINTDCTVFLDCGEGSYNQLVRNYGYEKAQSILKKTSCIFISHLHADHHLGLFTLLQERKIAFQSSNTSYTPVIIIAPEYFQNWLLNYENDFESISSLYKFIENDSLQFDNTYLDYSKNLFLKELRNIVEITTVPVKHCPYAYAAILKNNDWKIVYSGDTIPCQTLVDAGYGCNLLIHEATMEDDLEDEAIMKMHSTTSQAIEIAAKMDAKFTILTHFSQRYAKVPLINEQLHSHVGFAFDNMKVRWCDLPLIPLFIPTLQKLFAEHVEKLHERGNKRKEKKLICNFDEKSEEINV